MKKLFSFIVKISPILVLSFLTIGYAVIFRDLDILGTLNIKKMGKVEIVSLELDSSLSNPLSQYGSIILDPATGNVTLDYDFSLTGENEPTTYEATYLVTINNKSPFNYTYTGFNLNSDVSLSNANHGGATVNYQLDSTNANNTLNPGDTLYPNTVGVSAIKVSITVSSSATINISVDGDGSVDLDVQDEGELLASLNDSEVNLRGTDTIDCFNVSVINTYTYERNIEFFSSNKNFNLVDSSGNALGLFHIGAPDDNDTTANNKTFEICMKVNQGSTFVGDTSKTTITLSSGSINNQLVGTLRVLVDKEPSPPRDELPPEISNVTFSKTKYNTGSNTLTVYASWNGSDAENSEIDGYYVKLYDANDNSLQGTFPTNSDLNNFSFDLSSDFLTNNSANINSHQYYIKVYGKDAIGNNGSGYCNETTSTYCAKSSNISLKYAFTVTTSGTNTTFGNNKTAYFGNDYTIQLGPSSSSYELPDTITVKRTGTSANLTSGTHYTYTKNNNGSGTVKILASQVTNNLSITANSTSSSGGGTCLIEGTKIRLANGKVKNIEDIKYTDLLAVYSHEEGRIVYEYPIWIEQETEANEYQKTYFNDGTYIETYLNHGLFSIDSMKYVNILDKENLHEGTRVVKIDESGNIKIVSVVKQETYHKPIKYYHVSSVRYHNIIANDLLTTDGVLKVSNMYTFNRDLTWGPDRDLFLKEIENDTEYDLPVFPRHIYKGFRGPETKKLFDQGTLGLEEYVRLLNGHISPPIMDDDGNNLWMIGTSDGREELLKEGSVYKVPIPKYHKGIFVGWYNTGDNKYYQPGETFTVDYSMYLEAIYK